MKRTISAFQYSILKKELLYLEEIGELAPNQANRLLEHYEVIQTSPQTVKPTKKSLSLNFIQIISMIGAILVGLGVLSFVASNWSAMSDMTKFALLLTALVLSYVFAWWFEDRRPLLSKSLYYIGAFIYGAEIFYIGQMFHLGGEVGNAFFAWALGVIPLAIYCKDKYLYGAGFGLLYVAIELKFMLVDEFHASLWMLVIFPILFLGIRFIPVFQKYFLFANFFLLYQYIEMNYLIDVKPFMWLITIPILIGLFAFHHYIYPKEKYLMVANFLLLYQFIEINLLSEAIHQVPYMLLFGFMTALLFYIGHRWMKKSKILFVLNVLLGTQWIWLIFYHLGIEQPFVYALIVFIIGVFFTHYSIQHYRDVTKPMGYLFQFVAGLALTIPSMYDEIPALWVFFGIGYIIYGLSLVYKNQLFGVFVVSVLIFRFYVDLSLVFLNKSIAFFMGGILLLGLGYWFEKTRRGEKKHDKTKNTK